MIRTATLYAWAGFMYVWTLISVAALLYFPVYLDACATRVLPRGPILAYLRNAPGSPRKFDAPSLYRYSRHPFCTYLIVSLWLTPLMTADRLLWAALGSIHAVGIAGAEERRMERVFGGEYRAYRS